MSSTVTFGIGGAASSVSTNFFSRAAVAAAGHGFFQGTTTFISGGEFWSGGASVDANGNSIAGTGMKGLGGNLATNDYGMVAFGTVMGGASAELSGGNFWQGAVSGLVVSGLNHAMHRMSDDSEIDPPAKKGQAAKSKAPSMASKLHKMFDAIEEVGAWTEVAGVTAAPFTEGLSLAVEPLGFWEGAIGTAGNVGVDFYEYASTQDTKYLKTAAFRVTKFGITAGLGKAIDRIPGGSYMIDKTVLKINTFIYDRVVSPRIQSRLKI